MNLAARDIINPETKTQWLALRAQDITSTGVSALFGINPYLTHFELWHQIKSNDIVELSGNERTEWGKRLESSIATGIAEDQGWEIRPMTEYIRDSELRAGSSFDYSIESEEKDGEINNVNGILEVKNVDALQFRDGWIIGQDGDIEAPPHIEMQVQHQLMVSCRNFAYIGALVGGNRVVLIRRQRDEQVIEAIKNKIRSFWNSIEANNPPKPDFARDADFIAKLYSAVDPGSVMIADQTLADLAKSYKQASEQEKKATSDKKAIKAQILTRIGKHEKVKADEFSISASKVESKTITYTRQEYRGFRINWRKNKNGSARSTN